MDTPFHKDHYTRTELPGGVIRESWGQVEIVPGVVGPENIRLTAPSIEAMNAYANTKKASLKD